MRKNVASQIIGAQMVNIADGLAFTGTARVAITIDGGVQNTAPGGTVTHEGRGFHSYNPTQAETNGDIIAFTFDDSGSLAVPCTVQVYTEVGADISAINGVASAATLLEGSVSTNLSGIASGVPTTTTMVSDITVSVDDQYKGRVIIFDNDTTTTNLQGQATPITGCTASTDTLIFTLLTTTPVSGDTFQVV